MFESDKKLSLKKLQREINRLKKSPGGGWVGVSVMKNSFHLVVAVANRRGKLPLHRK